MASLRRPFLILAVLMFVLALSIGSYIAYQAVQTSSDSYILLMAADKGDADRVKSLLESGTNPNFSFEGHTPLSASRTHRFRQIEQLLLDYGAKK